MLMKRRSFLLGTAAITAGAAMGFSLPNAKAKTNSVTYINKERIPAPWVRFEDRTSGKCVYRRPMTVAEHERILQELRDFAMQGW